MDQIQPTNVKSAFEAFDPKARSALHHLRSLILKVAAENPRIGPIEETLKWGTPSYLPSQTKSGTTLRLGQPKNGGFAIYTHCQTTLIGDFQSQFPSEFTYEGNRAIVFQTETDIKSDLMEMFISNALTYHLT